MSDTTKAGAEETKAEKFLKCYYCNSEQNTDWLFDNRKVVIKLLELFHSEQKEKEASQLSGATNDKIEAIVNELAKESTAPDKETPDWMKSDIRRGVKAGLKLASQLSGAGEQLYREASKKCNTCNGSGSLKDVTHLVLGKSDRECFNCNGDGFIISYEPVNLPMPVEEKTKDESIECPYCDGQGYTSEHNNDPHENGCTDCPIQVPCGYCQMNGRITTILMKENIKQSQIKIIESDLPF